MDTVRNSVLLPDELFLAFSRFLGYQKDLNSEATSPNPCQNNLRRTYPISDDDSYDPCPTVSRFSMRRNNFEPEKDPLYRSTLNGSRQNESMTQKLPASCNKDDEYQCCNLPDCPNNSAPAQDPNKPTFPFDSLIPFHPLVNQPQHPRHSVSRSHSVPRHHDSLHTPHRFDHHNAHHVDPAKGSHSSKPHHPSTPCELNAPGGNRDFTHSDRYDRNHSSRNSTLYDWNDTSQIGVNYGEFQRRQRLLHQIQQQQNQQQQSRRHNQSNISWLDSDDPIVFQPDLNSTRINQDDCHQQSVKKCPQQAPRHQPKAACQMCNSSCSPQSTIPPMYECEKTPEMLRRQTMCESPQLQGRQMQYETELNRTSYLQPPESLKNARCRPQPNQSLGQNQCLNDVSLNRTPLCQDSMNHDQNSRSRNNPSCCGQGSTACGKSIEDNQSLGCCGNKSAPRNQTYLDMSQAMLGRSCLNQTSLDETHHNSSLRGRSMRVPVQTPEDRLIERIQNEFLETLVKDRFCPGILQASLDEREDFNQYAREIAFAGPVPAKPVPVDPITMIEAIKLRIDYERKEIRKEKDSAVERDRDLKNQSRDGRPRRTRPITNEDIEIHFDNKNNSEVNEGVAAFLKAEIEYRNTNMGTDSAFDAHINGIDSHLFDEKIKISSYTASTTPVYR
ncbi:uncharacterized protein LOC108027971 isoform X2 [Drosophila biarmipes]|uniref:uncharacterized protein LOC108027971 isoform X2 n=1 Tax=Drosophila biarmipes TaxID=125945 RepID=UPI0021CC5EEC|nr:uncharacterized protein LOC108027971 isoform X2 [Drosophila biarmipes]